MKVPGGTEEVVRSDFINRKAKGAGAIHEPGIIAGECDRLSLFRRKSIDAK